MALECFFNELNPIVNTRVRVNLAISLLNFACEKLSNFVETLRVICGKIFILIDLESKDIL